MSRKSLLFTNEMAYQFDDLTDIKIATRAEQYGITKEEYVMRLLSVGLSLDEQISHPSITIGLDDWREHVR